MTNGKRDILFLVHIEEMFDRFFPHNLREDVGCVTEGYDEVIALASYIEDDGPIWEVQEVATDTWQWSWGYYPPSCIGDGGNGTTNCTCLGCEERLWTIKAHGHEYTYIPEELRKSLGKFKACNIYVSGGSATVCMQDWLDVLEYVGLDYVIEDALLFE